MSAKGAFPRIVRQGVYGRSEGLCERCGMAKVTDLHHRRPRGMGGDRREDTASMDNALGLCRPCHDWVEGNRVEAREKGFLVRSSHDPATIPVCYRGRMMLLSEVTPIYD